MFLGCMLNAEQDASVQEQPLSDLFQNLVLDRLKQPGIKQYMYSFLAFLGPAPPPPPPTPTPTHTPPVVRRAPLLAARPGVLSPRRATCVQKFRVRAVPGALGPPRAPARTLAPTAVRALAPPTHAHSPRLAPLTLSEHCGCHSALRPRLR